MDSKVTVAYSATDKLKPAGVKLRGAEKLARIPVKVIPSERKDLLRKPSWIRAPFTGTAAVARLKQTLRENRLHTVCEEAACPNLGECFSHGTATFMIMGDICTRRCPFCEVGHGKPLPLDQYEPVNLAQTIQEMRLKYVVITSVDRDDLRDGGAGHFVSCIKESRKLNPALTIEVLTPDFRGRIGLALDVLAEAPPDVFNHNIETVPRLYREARPGLGFIERRARAPTTDSLSSCSSGSAARIPTFPPSPGSCSGWARRTKRSSR